MLRALVTSSLASAAAAIGLLSMGGLGEPPSSPVGASPAAAQAKTPAAEHWAVRGGLTTIQFNEQAMSLRGLSLAPPADTEVLAVSSARQFAIRRESSLTFSVVDGSLHSVLGGGILQLGDLTFTRAEQSFVLSDLIVVPAGADAVDATWAAEPGAGGGGLLFQRVKAGFDPTSRTLVLRAGEVRISPDLAAAMGEPDLAAMVIGDAIMHATAQWVGGARPDGGAVAEPAPSRRDPGTALLAGPDMTFCQLYGLYMPSGSRLGGTVGLSVGTTSWNIGGADLMWWAIPNEEHPFIVMNLYRLLDGRFEQIGQSHIKHGFYALSSHQCGGPPCTFEPGHGPGAWLGTGCTDTYGPSLNASQSGMGPRFEVNPWTGYWYYPGSHMQGGHSHNAIEHRIQAHDRDLDPAFNAGATYYCEGYYVVLDDINVMNSVSWKPVTVSGTSGANYYFGMSSSSTYPNIGFALDAWTGATQTIIAQEIPVQEFVSPDGRCVLAAKATQLDETTWHYEYALLNIDMDQQVGSISIPIGPTMTLTNVEFHAVSHHGEAVNTADPDAVSINNDKWVAAIGPGACVWATTTNPLRWGTLYNFRFDADAPPVTTTAQFGMFRSGAVTTLTGETIGPSVDLDCPADFDGDLIVGITDFLQLLAAWGPCPGCPEDLDGDDVVGIIDFVDLLASWGPCP